MPLTWRPSVPWRSAARWAGLLPADLSGAAWQARARRLRAWVARVLTPPEEHLWPAKHANEVRYGLFDFGEELEGGEEVVAAEVVVSLASGVDANPGAVLFGAPEVAGAHVLQRFRGGVPGARYRLVCTATLSSTDVLVLVAILPVRAS